MRREEYGKGRWSPDDGKGKRGGGNSHREKGYKKGNQALLCTCATPLYHNSVNELEVTCCPFNMLCIR